MSDTIRQLLRDLKIGFADLYGARLRGVYLYGSYAREEADSESDVDVLVVLDQVPHYAAEIDRTGPLVSTLSLRYGSSISRVFVPDQDWAGCRTPFLANVRDEAVSA
nr:nucleotidyltransferase domain-containing protein [Nitrospirota bacterium]